MVPFDYLIKEKKIASVSACQLIDFFKAFGNCRDHCGRFDSEHTVDQNRQKMTREGATAMFRKYNLF